MVKGNILRLNLLIIFLQPYRGGSNWLLIMYSRLKIANISNVARQNDPRECPLCSNSVLNEENCLAKVNPKMWGIQF